MVFLESITFMEMRAVLIGLSCFGLLLLTYDEPLAGVDEIFHFLLG